MENNRELYSSLMEAYGISSAVMSLGEKVERSLSNEFRNIDKTKEVNFYKVLLAMKKIGLKEQCFHWPTGYGYDDLGREKIDELFSQTFKTEDAIVRPSFSNGTHVLGLCLKTLLEPGDLLLSVTGKPYDTLDEFIGITGNYTKSLKKKGVDYQEMSFTDSGTIDFMELERFLRSEKRIRIVYLQRSTGYHFRKAITIDEIEKVVKLVKGIQSEAVIMVDNCYGEFLEPREPTDVGVDLMAGSLIKNPGGGIVLSGGYIAGKKSLISEIAKEHTLPGIERDCGLSFGQSRTIFQGLFYAPSIVAEALKSATFCGALFKEAGYKVSPDPGEQRSDIIQSIHLGSKEKVMDFCRAIQEVAPVDSFVVPEPWEMPGYKDPVIMAAGTFIQGSSIELSADAPIRPPYIVYFQGGLSYYHGKIGALNALSKLKK